MNIFKGKKYSILYRNPLETWELTVCQRFHYKPWFWGVYNSFIKFIVGWDLACKVSARQLGVILGLKDLRFLSTGFFFKAPQWGLNKGKEWFKSQNRELHRKTKATAVRSVGWVLTLQIPTLLSALNCTCVGQRVELIPCDLNPPFNSLMHSSLRLQF